MLLGGGYSQNGRSNLSSCKSHFLIYLCFAIRFYFASHSLIMLTWRLKINIMSIMITCFNIQNSIQHNLKNKTKTWSTFWTQTPHNLSPWCHYMGFHITGPLWGKSTGHWWIPSQRAFIEIWWFSLVSAWTSCETVCQPVWDAMMLMWNHCNSYGIFWWLSARLQYLHLLVHWRYCSPALSYWFIVSTLITENWLCNKKTWG